MTALASRTFAWWSLFWKFKFPTLEFLLADFALASHSIVSVTLTCQDLLRQVLEKQTFSAIISTPEIVSRVLEGIYASGGSSKPQMIIVTGDISTEITASIASNIKIIKFSDAEREGVKAERIFTQTPGSSFVLFPLSYNSFIPEPHDVFTISYSVNKAGQLQATHLTHENVVAGTAAIRGLLPASHLLSPLDTVASAFSLSSAYGRAVAYTAIYEGTSFATLPSSQIYGRKTRDPFASRTIPDFSFSGPSLIDAGDIVATKKYPMPSPTVLFIKPGHLKSVVAEILHKAAKSFILFSFAKRHKLAGVSDGFITRDSLWDKLVFDSARAKVIGDAAASMRAIIVSGGELRSGYCLWHAGLISPFRASTGCVDDASACCTISPPCERFHAPSCCWTCSCFSSI